MLRVPASSYCCLSGCLSIDAGWRSVQPTTFPCDYGKRFDSEEEGQSLSGIGKFEYEIVLKTAGFGCAVAEDTIYLLASNLSEAQVSHFVMATFDIIDCNVVMD